MSTNDTWKPAYGDVPHRCDLIDVIYLLKVQYFEISKGHSDIKWLLFRLRRSLAHPPSPELASELQLLATNLDSSTFFFVGFIKGRSKCTRWQLARIRTLVNMSILILIIVLWVRKPKDFYCFAIKHFC